METQRPIAEPMFRRRNPAAKMRREGTINTVLLITILVANTFYQSEWGGPGTLWNPLAYVTGMVIVYRTFRIRGSYIGIFSWPLFFVAVSCAVNISELQPNSLRSALGTSVGYALLALPPITLDRALLRRLATIYTIVCLGISIKLFVENPSTIVLGNQNYNINANAAAQQFFVCGVLSLLFVQSRLKWPLFILSALLMLTTQARTATSALATALIMYALISNRRRFPSPGRLLFNFARFVPIAAFALWALVQALPDYVIPLAKRYGKFQEGGELQSSRGFIWEMGLARWLESTRTMLFGNGPATLATLIGTGTHSSYIEALGSYGLLFILASVAATSYWVWAMTRRGHHLILILAVPYILYGATETILFSGMTMLWYLFSFTGMYLRSRDSSALDLPETAGTSAW